MSEFHFNKCTYVPPPNNFTHKLTPSTKQQEQKSYQELQSACRLRCFNFTPMNSVNQAICMHDCNRGVDPGTKVPFKPEN